MEREYFANHIGSKFRGLSTSQPRSKRKYLKDYSTYLKDQKQPGGGSDYLKNSKTAKYSTPAELGYEELGGLSDPEQRDYL